MNKREEERRVRRFDWKLEGEERGTDDRVKEWCKFNGRIWLCVGGRRGRDMDEEERERR